MPGVVRQGDQNTGGGIAQIGDPNVIVEGRPIVVNGTPVTGHRRHWPTVTANGDTNVLVGNRPVNVIGNADACGDRRLNGSSDVIVG